MGSMKLMARSGIDQWFAAAAGLMVLLLSVTGVVHSLRATIAFGLSRRAQLEQPAPGVDQILAWCRQAYAHYPWNYYFSIFAAETAYYRADEVWGEARTDRLRQSKIWCERGLVQNRYKSQLVRLKTRFLWEESPSSAIEYWKAYTQWQFWEPYNHATLAELYARHGDFDQADASLRWIEGDPSYPEAKKTVLREKRIWDDSVNGRPIEWGE